MKRFLLAIIIVLFSTMSAYADFCGFLRANTAADIKIGPFVDSVDGVTLESGLTISQVDVVLSKNGSRLSQKYRADSLVYDSHGYYWLSLGKADTNTVGRLKIIINESGSLLVVQTYQVLEETKYDARFGN